MLLLIQCMLLLPLCECFVLWCGSWCHKKVSEYDQEIPNHTLEINPLHRKEEPQNMYSNSKSVRQ